MRIFKNLYCVKATDDRVRPSQSAYLRKRPGLSQAGPVHISGGGLGWGTVGAGAAQGPAVRHWVAQRGPSGQLASEGLP